MEKHLTTEVANGHFADRWYEAEARCGGGVGGPVCVGIDPVWEKLPGEIREAVGGNVGGDRVEGIERFSMEVIAAVAGVVPMVKVQAACFERYFEGGKGVAAYHRVIAAAKDAGLLVIADAKRGDIGTSSAHYAAGLLEADALTINTYLGVDGMAPFIAAAAERGKGLFALVRTSNPGGDALQSMRLENGDTVGETVGKLVAGAGADYVGASGYSLLGAVVGATKVEEIAKLRALMPEQLFLVPGFGAQGGEADDVVDCFDANGKGAIITASRSVIYAFADYPNVPWRDCIRAAAIDLRDSMNRALVESDAAI